MVTPLQRFAKFGASFDASLVLFALRSCNTPLLSFLSEHHATFPEDIQTTDCQYATVKELSILKKHKCKIVGRIHELIEAHNSEALFWLFTKKMIELSPNEDPSYILWSEIMKWCNQSPRFFPLFHEAVKFKIPFHEVIGFCVGPKVLALVNDHDYPWNSQQIAGLFSDAGNWEMLKKIHLKNPQLFSDPEIIAKICWNSNLELIPDMASWAIDNHLPRSEEIGKIAASKGNVILLSTAMDKGAKIDIEGILKDPNCQPPVKAFLEKRKTDPNYQPEILHHKALKIVKEEPKPQPPPLDTARLNDLVEQLESMGFHDFDKNVEILLATNCSLSESVELLTK